jgi:hypothetical protein
LTETELLEVVTALEAAASAYTPAKNSRLTGMHALSRRIADQAAEQFHDVRLFHTHHERLFRDARQQLSLPYGPPSEWSYVYYKQG